MRIPICNSLDKTKRVILARKVRRQSYKHAQNAAFRSIDFIYGVVAICSTFRKSSLGPIHCTNNMQRMATEENVAPLLTLGSKRRGKGDAQNAGTLADSAYPWFA